MTGQQWGRRTAGPSAQSAGPFCRTAERPTIGRQSNTRDSIIVPGQSKDPLTRAAGPRNKAAQVCRQRIGHSVASARSGIPASSPTSVSSRPSKVSPVFFKSAARLLKRLQPAKDTPAGFNALGYAPYSIAVLANGATERRSGSGLPSLRSLLSKVRSFRPPAAAGRTARSAVQQNL